MMGVFDRSTPPVCILRVLIVRESTKLPRLAQPQEHGCPIPTADHPGYSHRLPFMSGSPPIRLLSMDYVNQLHLPAGRRLDLMTLSARRDPSTPRGLPIGPDHMYSVL